MRYFSATSRNLAACQHEREDFFPREAAFPSSRGKTVLIHPLNVDDGECVLSRVSDVTELSTSIGRKIIN